MDTNFYKLTVSNINTETADTVSIELQVPEHLRSDFSYIPGQYLTFRVFLHGIEYRRSYSICSSPYTGNALNVAVKKVRDGKVSTYFNHDLKVGDTVEVMIPNGSFHTEIDPDNSNDYIFFAGGSGITPIISIIESLLLIENKATVKLFYGSYNKQSLIFKNRLEQFAAEYANFQLLYLLEDCTEEEGYQKGRLEQEVIAELLAKRNPDSLYFICGPTIMMQNVESILGLFQVPKKNIYIEYFSAVKNSNGETAEIVEVNSVLDTNALSEKTVVKIILGGVETTIDYTNAKLPILTVALDHGLNAPYSCQEAICCSCRAKVVEGKVKMKNNYALTDEEVEEGYVLTCQSIPLTKYVELNYDV